MKVITANSVGVDREGYHIIHFPSRFTASIKSKPFTFYPYELAYLSSLLKRETDHEVKMLDGNLLQLNAEQYIDLIRTYQPDWLIMEPSTMIYQEDLKVAQAIKKEFGTKLVFTGQHATGFPKETIKDGVDYVCIGEYEYTVLELLKGEKPETIKGLFPNQRRELIDINDLPFPEDEDISRRDYRNVWGSDYEEVELFASRGCTMSCVFCVCRHLYYGRPNWRPRNVASVIKELKYLRNKYPDMEGIYFDEEYHNHSKEFIMELTNAIKENGLADLKYNAMCGYWTLDQDMIEAMRSAGYYKLRIGIETASEAVARAMGKKIDIPRLKSALKIARKVGLKIYGTFTIGAPMSTIKEDTKTARLIKELVDNDLLYDLQISICTPQPGTPFYQWSEKKGYLINNNWRDYDGVTTSVVSYPDYSNKEIEEMFRYAVEMYCGAHRRMEIRKYGFGTYLRKKISKRGMLATLWEGIKSIKFIILKKYRR